ncbi:SH3 domain-containing protein [Ekhidna sp.]
MQTRLFIFLVSLSVHFFIYSQSIEEIKVEKDSISLLIKDLEDSLRKLRVKHDMLKNTIAKSELDSIMKNSTQVQSSKSIEGKLRAGVNPQSRVLLTIPKNSSIQLLGYSNGYFQVIYQSKKGYLNELYVASSEEVDKFKKAHSESNYKFDLQTPNNSNSTLRNHNKKSLSRTYHRGPRGGCYYYSKTGKKVYVDRNLCN